MESLVSRGKSVLFEPRTSFKEVDTEFTKPGAIWGKYVIPLAAIGPIAGAVGRFLFGARIAGTSVGGSSFDVTAAAMYAVIAFILAVVAVFALSKIISLLSPQFGGQRNDVQALKVAAYSSTPAWVAGIFSLHGRFLMVQIIVSLYSLYLLYAGLPILMKVPKDRAMGYTAVVIIAAVVIFLMQSAYTLF
ncbi:MAG TPA: Yip1 family protein [Gemmatimonadales bacterium]|jgi:hypothetical protein|nr:Yip1 family protein [Gemmatimonadales bacterium]